MHGGLTRIRPAIVTVILAGLLIAGCGKDKTIAKADFVAAAGKICKGIDTKLIALDKTIEIAEGSEPTPEQQQEIVKGAGKIFKSASDELSKLDLPKEDRDVVENFLKEMHKGSDEVLAAAATPEKSVTLLESGRDPMEKANDLANKYGITECGGDS